MPKKHSLAAALNSAAHFFSDNHNAARSRHSCSMKANSKWCEIRGSVELRKDELPPDTRALGTELIRCRGCDRLLCLQHLRETEAGWRGHLRRHLKIDPAKLATIR